MHRSPVNRAWVLLHIFFVLHLSQNIVAQWTEDIPILEASDEADSANFGWSVGVDGSLAVVGALAHPSGGTRRGQAYVFRHNGTSWAEEQVLQASDELNGAEFGSSVTISGNVVVVGARGHYSGGISCGQAYVYRHNGLTWIEEQILQASDEVNGALFGSALAIHGDVIVVGAETHSSGGSVSAQRGQAYVFRHNGSVWVQEKILQAPDKADLAKFGRSVAVHGNVIAAGAPFHPIGTEGAWKGQAYAFRYNGADWSLGQIFYSPGTLNEDGFGFSVGVWQERVAISAPFFRSNGISHGRAFVYHHNGLGWNLEQALVDSTETDQGYFGYSLAFSGTAVLVTGGGGAYAFRRSGSTWSEEQFLLPSDGIFSGEGFGISSALSGNVAAIGAWMADSGGADRGQAYIYRGPENNSAREWQIYQ